MFSAGIARPTTFGYMNCRRKGRPSSGSFNLANTKKKKNWFYVYEHAAKVCILLGGVFFALFTFENDFSTLVVPQVEFVIFSKINQSGAVPAIWEGEGKLCIAVRFCVKEGGG